MLFSGTNGWNGPGLVALLVLIGLCAGCSHKGATDSQAQSATGPAAPTQPAGLQKPVPTANGVREMNGHVVGGQRPARGW